MASRSASDQLQTRYRGCLSGQAYRVTVHPLLCATAAPGVFRPNAAGRRDSRGDAWPAQASRDRHGAYFLYQPHTPAIRRKGVFKRSSIGDREHFPARHVRCFFRSSTLAKPRLESEPQMSSHRADNNNPRRRVRLIRKIAESLNGIDLSQYRVGDVFDLHPLEADLLMAEGWALAEYTDRALDRRSGKERREPGTSAPEATSMDDAAHPEVRPAAARGRKGRLDAEERVEADNQRRRAANAIREELQDSRAKTIGPGNSSEPT
jgi:hypothetical protein